MGISSVYNASLLLWSTRRGVRYTRVCITHTRCFPSTRGRPVISVIRFGDDRLLITSRYRGETQTRRRHITINRRHNNMTRFRAIVFFIFTVGKSIFRHKPCTRMLQNGTRNLENISFKVHVFFIFFKQKLCRCCSLSFDARPCVRYYG